MSNATAPKVAVVTGGASGIGLGIAQRLAVDGFRVAVLDLDAEAATAVADKITADGGLAMAAAVDVSNRDSVETAFATVRARFGPVTVLVNSAGQEGFKRFVNLTTEKWERIIAVNLTGTFHCCQVAVSDMIVAGWGRIVNISSSSAQSGQPFMTHYVASKAGVIGFTKALALELGEHGITVNTIPPGLIDTPMTRRNQARGNFGHEVEELAARTPVRRLGQPADIAAACAFLISEEAGYITGQVFGVNGGRNTA